MINKRYTFQKKTSLETIELIASLLESNDYANYLIAFNLVKNNLQQPFKYTW